MKHNLKVGYFSLLVPEIIEGVRRGIPASSKQTPGNTAAASTAVNVGGVGASGGGGGGGEVVPAPPAASGSVLRPEVDHEAADEEIIKLMTKCWSEDPYDRPDFTALKVAIRKINK